MNKQALRVHRGSAGHWVGDGFPVRTLFSYDHWGAKLSPFLMLDYAGPTEFAAATRPRGVGEHPHRGFETVTIVYQGEVAHRDSAGNSGMIGPGDVQWMTAGAGVLHDEFHSPQFARRGGTLEMVQLWVNLPAEFKMAPPRYQSIMSAQIPTVPLDAGAGSVRVIAGEFAGRRGPAATFTPLDVWDVRLQTGQGTSFEFPANRNVAVVVLRGPIILNAAERAGAAELVVVEPGGGGLQIVAEGQASFLVLSGAPIPEPVVGYGPFVMNTREEIETAVRDLRTGRFGRLPPAAF